MAADTRPLCVKLAGAVRREDFARFDATYADKDAGYWIDRSPAVVASLAGLLRDGACTGEQLKQAAVELVSRPSFEVVQIWPEGYGYRVKVSAAPSGMKPVESTMTAAQARQVFPQEALQVADEQGAATITGVEAEPDPLIETPTPITGFGIYKVYEEGTGKQYVGYVVPGLFDPAAGGPTSTHLFTNGNVHATQEQPFQGTLVGLNTNLPESSVVRGFGVFYRANDKAIMMTVPYEVLGEVTLTGNTSYAARDRMGQEVQIVFSPGLKRPVVAPPNTVALPADCKFLALDNPIVLSTPTEDVMAQAKAASADTRLRIKAWEDGTCHLSGAAVEKIGSGTHSWRDGLFWMAACGIKQAQAVGLLTEAARAGRHIDLYRVRPLSAIDDVVKEAEHRALAEIRVRQELPEKTALLLEAVVLEQAFQTDAAAELFHGKEAAAAIGAQTVDAVLSLNFINPETVDTFVEGLPQLEEASSKLAQLSFATSLGLDGVDSTAVSRAMDSLETVIEGLKSLRRIEV